MKAVIGAIITMIIFLTLFYLIASFVEDTFSISEWKESIMIFIIIIGGIISMVMGLLVGIAIELEND